MPPWTGYVALTVVCWGVYGLLLHAGATSMDDAANGRLKAFLFIGLAYFLVAVLAPLALLVARGASWNLPPVGMAWSLAAGVAGAVGALGVVLAFGARASPALVMSLVFAGAPVINGLVSVTQHGQWGQVRWPFVAGIVLAAVGGGLVTWHRPPPAPHGPPAASAPHRP
jgi:hypothetical protein